MTRKKTEVKLKTVHVTAKTLTCEISEPPSDWKGLPIVVSNHHGTDVANTTADKGVTDKLQTNP